MASSTQFDIFGKAQINPSATQAVQNIFITAGTAANQMVHTCQPEVNTVNAQIYDMYYLSSTSPCPIENEIIRKTLPAAGEACEVIMNDGCEAAMNRFNGMRVE